MNELDDLARLRADVAPPDPATLARIRAQLDDDRPTVRALADAPSRRRRLALSVSAAAAVAAGAVVLSLTSGAPHHGGPAAAPGTTTPPASHHSTAPPAATAFQHVTTHRWSITQAGLEDRGVWYLSEDTLQQWVPADWSGTWYWDVSSNSAQRFLSVDDKDYVRAQAPELLQPGTDITTGTDGVPDADRGIACEPGVCTPGWDYLTTDFVAQLPTDPAALRASLYAAARKLSDEANHYGKTDDVDSEAFNHLQNVLDLGYLPTDLQAALYQVATTIPGVTAVAHETDLDGTDGVGLSKLDRFGDARTDLMFTSSGGTYLGARTTVVSSDWNAHNDSNTDPPQPITHVPVGTVIADSAVHVDTVTTPPNSVVGPSMPLPSH